MADATRNGRMRINEKDRRTLKLAKEEFEADIPLGLVARKGAQKIIEDSENEVGF